MNSTRDSQRPAGPEGQDQVLGTGEFRSAVERRLHLWEDQNFADRFWAKDHTLWLPKPQPELTDRMGWMEIFEPMHDHFKDMFEFAEQIKGEGFSHVVLMGMGGSSLAPEVFHKTFGRAENYPSLLVLDSTHPETIRKLESQIDLSKTLFIVSSKSGATTETLSFFFFFWNWVSAITPAPGKQFIAITDAESPLMKISIDRGFRKVYKGPEEVGGRYSALTLFGLIPAALIGIDSHQLLDRGWDMAEASASYLLETENPSLFLGAVLGELALAGHDKATFFTTSSLASFPLWIEQLIAESTGKGNKGIIPVIGEEFEEPWVYRKDRLFIQYSLESEADEELEKAVVALEAAGHPVIRYKLRTKYDLGQEIFRWEMAVAAASSIIGINPFDQPDVQLAKEMARQAMEQKTAPSKGIKPDRGEDDTISLEQKIAAGKAFESFIGGARIGDYISIQAYLAPDSETEAALQDFRLTLRDRLKLATTFGWGPRFLHSTGQLHKGGPGSGIFIQLIDEPENDISVPETNYTFGQLIFAQALGDFRALKQRNRRVIRLNLGHDTSKGLERLFGLLGS
jgi:transaldolase/glucose-6-phosphate isomerase